MSEDQTKIVAPSFREENNKPKPEATPRLNAKTATELGGALQRFHELRDAKIKTPTSDAELAGLTEFIANTLITYSSELLGCWFVTRNEYEPLVNCVSNILARSAEVANQRNCAQGKCPCKQ